MDPTWRAFQALNHYPLAPRAKMGLDKPWSDFSDSTETSSSQRINNKGLLAAEMSDISLALSQLYRITILIQRSGNKYRFKRADNDMPNHENDKDYIELKKHLQFIILLGQQDIHTEFGEAEDYEKLATHVTITSNLSPIHHALVKANMLRRNRIRHATRHLVEQRNSKPYAKQPELATGETGLTVSEASGPSAPQKSGVESGDFQEAHQPPAASTATHQDPPTFGPLVNTPMTATELGTMPLMSSQRKVNHKSEASEITRITRIGVRQDYPPCPATFRAFQCPYCAQALSGDYTNISRWRYEYLFPWFTYIFKLLQAPHSTSPKANSRGRGHVKQDLMPYTCVFENCKSLKNNEFFESSEEWMAHLVDTHSETCWVCSLCPAGPDDIDEAMFESIEAWQNHIRSVHPDMFPENQLEGLAGLSERVSLRPMACPLCQRSDETEAQPYDHIASHLHEFALRALPWMDNPKGESYSNSVSSLRTENGHKKFPRSTVEDDDNDISEDDQPPMGKGDNVKQLLEQIDAAMTKLRLRIPTAAQGCHGVLGQLPQLLNDARILGFDSVSKDQHHDGESVNEAAMTSTDREDRLNDRLEGHVRPLLRIQGIVHTFCEQLEHKTEQEVKELEERLQDECAALRQLLDSEVPVRRTEFLVPAVSERAIVNVFEAQEDTEAVMEEHVLASQNGQIHEDLVKKSGVPKQTGS